MEQANVAGRKAKKLDRAFWQEHLAQAEQDVIEAHNRVARQREIIAELERGGHRVTAARGMLAAFERLLAMHLADRARLREELGERYVLFRRRRREGAVGFFGGNSSRGGGLVSSHSGALSANVSPKV